MSNMNTALMVGAGALATIASQVTAFVKNVRKAEKRTNQILQEASSQYNQVMDYLDDIAKAFNKLSAEVNPPKHTSTLGEVISSPDKPAKAKNPQAKKVTKPSKPAKKVTPKPQKAATRPKTAK
jgi:formiminotetrahydrofolate cyclodeaminase